MTRTQKKLFSDKKQFSKNAPRDESALQQRITVSTFPAIYRKLICLRFPMDVAEIIELRDSLNQSLEHAVRARLIPDFHEYAKTLNSAVEQLEIKRQHHSEKLTSMLALFRELHYRHTLSSRNREIQLRQLVEQNREAQSHSVRFGIASLLTAAIGFIVLLALPHSGWLLKAILMVSAIATLDFFQSLRILDKEHKILSDELGAVIRDRVENIQWESLSRNIASILGYRSDERAFLIHSSVDGFSKDGLPDDSGGFHYH